MKTKLRVISGIMLIVAIVFVVCALSNPGLGQVIYISDYYFGPEQWRVCYLIYAIIMVALFVASFFVRRKDK